MNNDNHTKTYTVEVNQDSSFQFVADAPLLREILKNTDEITQIVEQVLDMSIDEQNLLLSLLHRKITDQRKDKVRELAEQQKHYQNALNFFNKFK